MAGEEENGKVRDPGEAHGSGRPGRCKRARKPHLRGGATYDERRAFMRPIRSRPSAQVAISIGPRSDPVILFVLLLAPVDEQGQLGL